MIAINLSHSDVIFSHIDAIVDACVHTFPSKVARILTSSS